MPTWPVEIPAKLQQDIEAKIFERSLRLKRESESLLHVTYAGDLEHPERLVAIRRESTFVRLAPTLGNSPMLVFPQPPLVCPAGATLECTVLLPVQLQLGAGDGDRVDLVRTFEPPHLSRALYGPVDAGVVCWSVRSPACPTIEDARSHQRTQFEYGAVQSSLHAPAALRVRNETSHPLEVAKIMLPVNHVALYAAEDRLYSSLVKMRLLSDTEAELEFAPCPVPNAQPVHDLSGRATTSSRRSFMFSHSYRNKTGLEFGF